jgi:hypothetical protein
VYFEMHRALGATVLVAVCLVQAARGQNLELPKLPYDYKDLEPWIDHETMTIHHMVGARSLCLPCFPSEEPRIRP